MLPLFKYICYNIRQISLTLKHFSKQQNAKYATNHIRHLMQFHCHNKISKTPIYISKKLQKIASNSLLSIIGLIFLSIVQSSVLNYSNDIPFYNY